MILCSGDVFKFWSDRIKLNEIYRLRFLLLGKFWYISYDICTNLKLISGIQKFWRLTKSIYYKKKTVSQHSMNEKPQRH